MVVVYPNFLITQHRIFRTKLLGQKQLDSSSHFDIIPVCVGQTDRRKVVEGLSTSTNVHTAQTDGQPKNIMPLAPTI